MERSILAATALGGGVVVTLLTGVVQLRTLAGATHYGVPVAWLVRRTLGPGRFPWRLNWVGLLADVAFWAAVVLVALLVYDRIVGRT